MKTTLRNFFGLPRSRLGQWAVGLAAASIPLVLAWSMLPGGAWLGFLCGLAGGVLALTAIFRLKERSWLTFLSVLPMLNVVAFLVAEFVFPH